MKRSVHPSLAALLAALFLLAACSPKQPPLPEGSDYRVWFVALSEENKPSVPGAALASELRRVPQGADPVEGLLAALLAGPISEGLGSPFPGGVSLRSVTLEEGVLTVDMEERYGGLGGVGLTLADSCIVLTLCQVEGVDAVTITVEGRPVPFRDRQVLTPDDLILTEPSQT